MAGLDKLVKTGKISAAMAALVVPYLAQTGGTNQTDYESGL